MKVQIIGGSGTGKSTLGKFISEKEKVKWIDTDNYLWKDHSFTETFSIEERKKMYEKDIGTHKEYVVSGSIFSWCPAGFSNRDLLVFLFLDEKDRMNRLHRRETDRNSRFWQNEKGEDTNDFLEWCKTYLTAKDSNMLFTYADYAYQMEVSKSPILKLDGSLSLEELYAEILNFYKEK
ncbi:AAA family ATPase [Planococcus sp. S3-L1]|uniref:shikimate kinase n=1 Tax=Planococcus sp. S3-L1 TaxID=3046200 RepID=UPI0024B9EC97|nr:AAA family ATPase [Planococcus sp. S3-L1]MDJ0333052.1 AAA family ATPase [Planococcus sp. S3-L1]